MSMNANKVTAPRLCLDPRDYTYGKFNGKTVRFGPASDPSSRRRYEAFVRTWLRAGRQLLRETPSSQLTPCTLVHPEVASLEPADCLQAPPALLRELQRRDGPAEHALDENLVPEFSHWRAARERALVDALRVRDAREAFVNEATAILEELT